MATPFLKGVEHLFTGQSYEGKYKKIGQGLQTQHGLSQAALQQALAAINKGYGGATDYLNQQGALGTKMLLDRERQSVAGAQQSSIDRGLYDSTSFDASSRGIGADTDQALADLHAQLSQQGSNIRIGQGQSQAQVYQAMAGSEDAFNELMLNLGLNTQYGKQGGVGNAVLSLIGGLFGAGGSNVSSKTGTSKE